MAIIISAKGDFLNSAKVINLKKYGLTVNSSPDDLPNFYSNSELVSVSQD